MNEGKKRKDVSTLVEGEVRGVSQGWERVVVVGALGR